MGRVRAACYSGDVDYATPEQTYSDRFVATPASVPDRTAGRLVLAILGCCAAIFLVACVRVFWFLLHFPVAETEVYKQSVAVIEASRDAQNLLGRGSR